MYYLFKNPHVLEEGKLLTILQMRMGDGLR